MDSTGSISQVNSKRLCANCRMTRMAGEEMHMSWVRQSSYFEGYSVGNHT